MASQPMQGVRVVEVAQYTFVPAAGAVLAEWGAEVIKVEHAERGDAQRGLFTVGSMSAGGPFAPLMEHPNHNKRSIGLALEVPEGLEILHRLVRNADVFLTNFLPDARSRLHIDVEDMREVNPQIIYVRGTALGVRGEDRTRPGFDGISYWYRAGSAFGATPPNVEGIVPMPAPAYGDSIGGMTIAGGVSAALFARERTGEAVGRRRLAPRRGCLGQRIGGRDVVPQRSTVAERADGAVPERRDEPARRCLPDEGRSLDRLEHVATGEVLGRVLPPPRPGGPHHRPPL